MGGKGIRRREKNYRAAHGGSSRLPPPPDPSSVDAVPSKLRKIMSLAGAVRQPSNGPKKSTGNAVDKGIHSGEGTDSMTTGMKRKRTDQSLMAQPMKNDNDVPQNNMHEKKKKKKRKNKKADDLRFETVGAPGGAGSQRKERKKQRLEARKKKHKKPRTDEDDDFPGHEQIKFGDVVEAPPKLIAVPKAFKKTQDASQERLRLQAVDAYRKRKGWASRPGVQLPPPVTTSPFF
ncbi:uncharacterized protein LOC105173212 [Sesamum indicum]|uniref:Uncharacterized protein LOC105173212 n=1 Tax=Sesamum indicum TaxID=4182 RepID=A0A6I9U7D1_SESIN|nr:uncharacterized protein LOC105173212 [Sesamum indicum]